MALKTLFPSSRWMRLVWSPQAGLSTAEELALSAVDTIPGCDVDLSRGWCDIPHTAWMLEPVHTVVGPEDAAKLEARLEATRPFEWNRAYDERYGVYGYQRAGVLYALEHTGSLLLADEMGLGKTRQAIAVAESLRIEREGPVIIAGPQVARASWRNELRQLGLLKNERSFCALATRNYDDDSFWPGADYYFIHYDIVRAWWSRLYGKIKRASCIIFDEVHKVRNSKTQRAKGALMLTALSPFRVALTGTPIENRPSDLWNVLTLLTGPRTWGGPLDFRQRYGGAYHNGYGWQDGEPTHTDELQARLKPFYLRRTTAEVGLELPELRRRVHLCELRPGEQAQHDDAFKLLDMAALVEALLRGAVSDDVLQTIIWLRQLTSRAKIRETVELVEDLIEQDERVIVFTHERQTAGEIKDRLGTDGVLHHGGLSTAMRESITQAFQAGGEGPAVLVSTLDSLSESVTLHSARVVISHDLDWVLTKILQAEKRIHRIGQHFACQAIWMVAKGSIDAVFAAVLGRKARQMDEALGIKAGTTAMEELNLKELFGLQTLEERVAESIETWSNT